MQLLLEWLMIFFERDDMLNYFGVIHLQIVIAPCKNVKEILHEIDVVFPTYGLSVFDNFIIFCFSSVPMLHFSTSSSLAMILGFLATSFSSNSFSRDTYPFGMILVSS
jgi:hypothetical protein